MNPLLPTVATFAVSAIFLVWQNYRQALDRRRRVLRSRVAYMLWVMANREDGPAPAPAAAGALGGAARQAGPAPPAV
jgi:hypothetical protein